MTTPKGVILPFDEIDNLCVLSAAPRRAGDDEEQCLKPEAYLTKRGTTGYTVRELCTEHVDCNDGIGTERDNFKCKRFRNCDDLNKNKVSSNYVVSDEKILREHTRLGHMSFQKLQKMLGFKHSGRNATGVNCQSTNEDRISREALVIERHVPCNVYTQT